MKLKLRRQRKQTALPKGSGALLIQPMSSSHSVLTYFWVDNFDMNLETKTGNGAINSTHMVAFQEESPSTIKQSNEIQFPRTKRRSMEVFGTDPVEALVNANKEPPITCFTDKSTTGESLQECTCATDYLLWIILRKLNMADQTLSTYSGWRTCVKKHNPKEDRS